MLQNLFSLTLHQSARVRVVYAQPFPFSLDLIDHKSPVGCGSEFQRHEYLLGSERLVQYAPMGEEDPGGDG